ncbi:Crp/Fnr family transcriptional regulator [Treponema pectinovorum]|uniref:Crp/Fnr family transcriptional regulator n=1 Tax=Treponema pectinovorum TaxID=164 RepID=UPI0011C90189|nr:Crp/Fnr family transcriptional regulator [Treponema pectinovorum]
MQKDITSYTEIPLFEKILPSDLDTLLICLHSRERLFNKGDLIIMDEENVNNIGIVLSGTVKMVKYDFWGREAFLSYMNPGELFGESFAVQSQTKSYATFVAVSQTKVLFLRAENIIHNCPRACTFHSQLTTNMFNLLGRKSVNLMEKIEIDSKPTLRRKILAYLSMQAQKQGSNIVQLNLNRTELAAFLNSNRSAMTRELYAMQDEGLIDFEKSTFTLHKID